ncbi:MAG: hydrogenase maturation protease [Deltaproteobacteria bacterium]|nr:hydrogenase maturation protease [Deltaproteobacteria bacterium]
MAKRLLVLFLGNILRGDDGVGIELLKRVSNKIMPDNVKLEEGSTGGMILLGIFKDYEKLLIVDAIDTGDYSKDVVIFSPSDIFDDAHNVFSLHSIGIIDVLRLSKRLEEKIPEVTIFGIQVRDTSEHIGLSPAILKILNDLEERLYRLILELSRA